MTATPTDRRYTKSHEWVLPTGALLTVGITDHAQSELTDIVFVELPKPGRTVAAGESVVTLESVKTVADVYAPAAGTIDSVNGDLTTTPGLINQDAYGKGWIYRLKPAAPLPPESLLDAHGYELLLVG